ncbi:MAG: helix-turn-helix domain-containing protein [Oscillibacter sp.]|nr:helix-turn-helix domain-containing protein [Oscillibacter sp.]
MRKHQLPLGWSRRDPRHYRFPLPNAVWEYRLKPIEFVIFSYLCYHHTHGQGKRLTPKIVAEGISLSTSTAKKHLVSLISKGLITDEWTLTPSIQNKTGEKFFTLPNELFLLKLLPSTFMVYAYLLLIEDRRTNTCHPSYNTIAAAAGMSKNTAIKSISALLEMGLITVEASSYFDKRGMKWKGNNLYTILPIGMAVDAFHRRQLCQLELDTERRRVRRRQEEYDRCHPRTALYAPASAQAASDPSQLPSPLYTR